MRVAEALLDRKFLDRTHAIEKLQWGRRFQASISFDGAHYIVYRIAQPESTALPPWHSIRGTGVGKAGSYGLWLPHLPDLLAECTLVEISDVPPPHDECNRYGDVLRQIPWESVP